MRGEGGEEEGEAGRAERVAGEAEVLELRVALEEGGEAPGVRGAEAAALEPEAAQGQLGAEGGQEVGGGEVGEVEVPVREHGAANEVARAGEARVVAQVGEELLAVAEGEHRGARRRARG